MALTLSQIEARVDAAGRRPGWAFVRRHPLLVSECSGEATPMRHLLVGKRSVPPCRHVPGIPEVGYGTKKTMSLLHAL